MTQLYVYSIKGVKNIEVIIHIYGALAILILFWDHQDTESESWDIKIGVAGTLLTQKKTSKALWDNNIHTLQYMRNSVDKTLIILYIHNKDSNWALNTEQ